jgi:hypothetical protein
VVCKISSFQGEDHTRGRYIPNHFLVTGNSHECPNKVTWGGSMEKPMVHIALRINAHGKITEYWIGVFGCSQCGVNANTRSGGDSKLVYPSGSPAPPPVLLALI